METTQTIVFKDPLWITAWLDAALRKEKEKYRQCPITRDVVPEYEAAQAWGYVVAGYFLCEESFKALLFIRGKQVHRKHSLSMLFSSFNQDDKDLLREYYADFKAAVGGNIGSFPFKDLDSFLGNLDGDKNKKETDNVGSFDWRYFLIEERSSRRMPIVSVDYIHEIVYGCTRIFEHARFGTSEPYEFTWSWRMRRERTKKYMRWFTRRMNSHGWDELGDRIELVWGPDYRDRYDLYVFKDGRIESRFSTLPEDSALSVVDKREEITAADDHEGGW